MNKVLLIFLISSISLKLLAQERSHATLELLFEHPNSDFENNVVQIYFNNKPAATVKIKEKLVYTIYSEGRVSLTFVENQTKINKVLDVRHDSSYHYLYGYYRRGDYIDIDKKDKHKYVNSFISKAIADEITKNVIQNTLYEEEDWRNPFGVLPESFSQRPKQGSGFLVADKYVVTNYHVIDGAKTIKLLGVEGDFTTELQASVKAVDVQNDLALLQIESKLINFSTIPYRFKSSENTRVGANAYAMGYPISNVMGNEVKITDGIINSNSGYKGSLSLYQFSAAVQPGNSGGPLFNSQGDIIGVVTAKLRSEETESIGYAVKADNLMLFLKQAGIEYLAEGGNSGIIELTDLVERNSAFIYLIKTE